jgi:hypothetical protein
MRGHSPIMEDVTEDIRRRVCDWLGLLQEIVLLEGDSIRKLGWQYLPTLSNHRRQTSVRVLI